MPVDPQRQNSILQALRQAHLDALFCRLPENVLFLTGAWPLSGVTWALLTTDGLTHLIVPACEADEARAEGITELSTYEWAHLAAPDPGKQIANILNDLAARLGLTKATIGIEEGFESLAPPLNIAEPVAAAPATRAFIQHALPHAKLTDATALIHALRVRKTPAEIEKMRRANHIAAFGFEAIKQNVAPGKTDIELLAAVNAAIAVKGAGYQAVKSARGFAQVSSGPAATFRGWRPCEITTPRTIKKGDIVLLELAVVADGYWADNTRLFVAGSANQKQRDIYQLVLDAQTAARHAIAPGVKMSDVDHAARDIINRAGYGQYFIHVTGHGLGWRYHEFPPLLHPDVHDHLEIGMLTSVEPGLYIPDFGGMRIEDNVAVTAQGPDCLSTFERNLE